MPDWEIKLWNTSNFDIHSVPFVEQAYNARKWAFAADYIRVYALYTEGGVYLDSDVYVLKNMDFVLENRAFSAVELWPELVDEIYRSKVNACGDKINASDRIHGIQIQAAILGAEKGHPFFKDCLEHYQNATFRAEENGIPNELDISPIVMASIAERYGFKYLDIEQDLAEGLKLYPSRIFGSYSWFKGEDTVAVHCCSGSWRKTQNPIERILYNGKIYLKRILKPLGLYREKGIENIRK